MQWGVHSGLLLSNEPTRPIWRILNQSFLFSAEEQLNKHILSSHSWRSVTDGWLKISSPGLLAAQIYLLTVGLATSFICPQQILDSRLPTQPLWESARSGWEMIRIDLLSRLEHLENLGSFHQLSSLVNYGSRCKGTDWYIPTCRDFEKTVLYPSSLIRSATRLTTLSDSWSSM